MVPIRSGSQTMLSASHSCILLILWFHHVTLVSNECHTRDMRVTVSQSTGLLDMPFMIANRRYSLFQHAYRLSENTQANKAFHLDICISLCMQPQFQSRESLVVAKVHMASEAVLESRPAQSTGAVLQKTFQPLRMLRPRGGFSG